MEKIININFQGRVIAIEESAYTALKQYIDALGRHFANEESSEEIISDIEGRIAELLNNRLKQGAPCINVADMNAVIDSIGRLEDIRAADGEDVLGEENTSQSTYTNPPRSSRLFRNADDKVIAGVCSGLSIRMNLDPVIVRILFVLFSGALFWVYILLWIIVPMQSLQSNTTHRLFRNPDDKAIAGVCGGLSTYFHMDSWKIRLLFLLPLIISMLFRSMDVFTWNMGWGPGFFVGSFGSTVFVLYIILWIAVPYATTATDKMEMRGEKIDINSIKAATQARNSGAAATYRSTGSDIARVLSIILKAFFLLVAGSVALGLFGALIGLVFAGTAAMPYAGFFLSGMNEYVLIWMAFALVMGIPLIALIVWIIRRIMGVRSTHHYLAYIFSALWIIGIVCGIYMTANVLSNFSTKASVDDALQIDQPSKGALYINVKSRNGMWQGVGKHDNWFDGWDEEQNSFRMVNNDQLWLSTVKVNIEQSKDSLFHINVTRTSRGKNALKAKEYAGHIAFEMEQMDSILALPRGFVINKADKFRNQQIILTVFVPIGKTINVSKDIDEYCWIDINPNDRHKGGRSVRIRRSYNNRYGTDKEYIMTLDGLKKNGAADTEDASDSEDADGDDDETEYGDSDI